MPNPWDVGSAKLFASLGFAALGTTSSGHAATVGKMDGSVHQDDVLAYASGIADAVDLPVSADLENGFGIAPEAVYSAVRQAATTALAGCSIEDFTGDASAPLYDRHLAAERVRAAAEAAHSAESGLVLTARAENFFRGVPDLADTIARLQLYQEAGADVLYAPGLTTIEDIRSVVASVDAPVNVLVRPGIGTLQDLADAGVARLSVGGAFAQVAFAAVARAGRELLAAGSFEFLDAAAEGRGEMTRAFTDQ
ncbi:2-methylisocitrate lyase-like PEP mutase family enzyme [Arthrobacter roseus]|nr:2-methylisocitrate lyase-like PEP mutase family enzyme [Arthrobacter roseus]